MNTIEFLKQIILVIKKYFFDFIKKSATMSYIILIYIGGLK